MSNYAIDLAQILFGLAVAGAIIMPLINSLSNPKSLIKPVIGIAALVVVFFIAYSVSSNEVTPVYQQYGVNASGSQVIGGVLATTYILMGLALVGALVNEVSKIFR